MNKIVIDTAALKALLSAHPEIEIELLAVATEKVGEELKRKMMAGFVKSTVANMTQRITDLVNENLVGYRSERLNERTAQVIREVCYEVLTAQTKAVAEQTARDAAEAAIVAMLPRLEERLVQHQEGLLKSVNAFVGGEIERQINARLNAMMKLTEGLQSA